MKLFATLFVVFLFLLPSTAQAMLIVGGSGMDSLYGTRYSDTVKGRGGSDQIFGRQGSDLLVGGRGHDSITGGRGADLVAAGPGSDIVYVYGALSGIDSVSCGRGSGDIAFIGPLDHVSPNCETVQVVFP